MDLIYTLATALITFALVTIILDEKKRAIRNTLLVMEIILIALFSYESCFAPDVENAGESEGQAVTSPQTHFKAPCGDYSTESIKVLPEELNATQAKINGSGAKLINVAFPSGYEGYDFSAKPYMDYRAITDESSKQYNLLWSDELHLDDRGFIIDNEGYIAVAMGSYFGEVGKRFNVELDNGKILKVFKVEVKSDEHTCENNFMGKAGDIIEFVIDTQSRYMLENVSGNGYIFNGNFNNCPDFNGNIIKITEVK